jgi:amino acid adenylation domain-containing protein
VTAYLLQQLLTRSAERVPDNLAVIDGDRSLTYLELEQQSNRLARLLVELGVVKGDRVALYLDKSLESVVGIYGALKAGAAYVPLDPQAPVTRLAYIAADCDVRCVLTGTEKAGNWRALVDDDSSVPLVVLNGSAPEGELSVGLSIFDPTAIDAQAPLAPAVEPIGLDLAYILYTSGSTGNPKGVMLSHLNALTFVRWAAEEFAVTATDRVSSHAPFHFDLSVFDLFAPALAGATVVLVPPRTSVFPIEVRRFIDRHNITVWYSVPSILTLLLLRGGLEDGQFPALRTMLFAGEVFPTKYLRELMRRLPHVRFANLYGPTETNVCTWYEVPPLADDRHEPIPIGRAMADVEVFAVDGEGRRVPKGATGELLVRGSTVMQGYWGDPERTARVLVPNPLDGMLPDRVYRTGDLVQELDDGTYRFLGRRDAQIKSRGYRIELGDIEAAIYAHDAVAECAVVAVPDELVTNRIKLYVVVRDSTSERDLARFCADRIPRYMIPDCFEFRVSLPKTSTGKIDRQALQADADQTVRSP